jgi:ferredoxin--NADP+ reductase
MSIEPVLNLYTIKNPVICEVLENRRLTPDRYTADNDVRHLVLRPQKEFPYMPGQSVGVILPGLDPYTKKLHKPRLYSIASKRGGDMGGGNTLSLCVVRHFWEKPGTNEIDIPGLISNY